MRDPKEPQTRLLALTFSSEYPLNPTEIRKIAQVEIPRIHKHMKNDLKDFVNIHDNYTLPNIASGSVYDVVVVAYNTDSTIASYSNVVSINADLFPKPQFNYVSNASVNHETGDVEISCHVDNAAVIDYYRVLRSTRDENIFSDIAQIPFNGQSEISYTDYNVNTSSNYYNYHIHIGLPLTGLQHQAMEHQHQHPK